MVIYPKQGRRGPRSTAQSRRSLLAVWLQARRRKRAQPNLLPAPVLRAQYPSLLAWDWELANPFKWNVWMSLDSGASWTLHRG